ncbi:MAG TPA: methyltransferase domain-containing protein [Syntrophobacter fumaroxidans]|nr:methyltransferase domain-containing protein [Syntrophobacter fumaroxidans]
MKTSDPACLVPGPPTGHAGLLYERLAASGAAADVIRPGGLPLTERALTLCSFPPGSRLLDVGCGVGTTVLCLTDRHGHRAAGIDPSALMIETGRRRYPGLWLMRGQGEALPFADDVLDGVLAECSLSVSRDADRVVREIHRTLTAEGRLLMSDVYARNPEFLPELRRLGLSGCLGGIKSMDELAFSLGASGFEILHWEDHSAELKLFAARLILSGGFAADFRCLWGECGGEGRNPEKTRQAVSRVRPGYFLLIAGKRMKKAAGFRRSTTRRASRCSTRR